MDEDADPPPTRRAELMERLQAALPRQLGWLRDHGYELTRADWPSARLESPATALTVGYSPTHGSLLTLGVALREHGDPQPRSLGSLQRLSGVPEHPSRDWLIESVDDVERALARISQELRTVEPLVAGDPEAFRSVRRRYKEALTADALEYALEGHLERHQQGWLDYARRNRAG